VGKIGVDANIFLSVLLSESTIADKENVNGSERILKSIGSKNTAVTSSIVLAEVAWAFLREGKAGVELEAAKNVMEAMRGLEFIKVDNEIAWDAGKLRRKHYSKKTQLSYQDAVYLATCVKEGAEVFYTTDSHLLDIKAEVPVREAKKFI